MWEEDRSLWKFLLTGLRQHRGIFHSKIKQNSSPSPPPTHLCPISRHRFYAVHILKCISQCPFRGPLLEGAVSSREAHEARGRGRAGGPGLGASGAGTPPTGPGAGCRHGAREPQGLVGQRRGTDGRGEPRVLNKGLNSGRGGQEEFKGVRSPAWGGREGSAVAVTGRWRSQWFRGVGGMGGEWLGSRRAQ